MTLTHWNKKTTGCGHTYPIFILNNILANAGEGGPLAVINGFNGTLFMYLALAHFTAQSMRCNTCINHSKESFLLSHLQRSHDSYYQEQLVHCLLNAVTSTAGNLASTVTIGSYCTIKQICWRGSSCNLFVALGTLDDEVQMQ